MKKKIRKNIKRSISILTAITCLGTSIFTYTPNAAVLEPNAEITDSISENGIEQDNSENNEMDLGISQNLDDNLEDRDNSSLYSDVNGNNAIIEQDEKAQEYEENLVENIVSDNNDQNLKEAKTDFQYEVVDGCATVIGYNGKDTILTIPEIIDTYPVTAIGDSAFQDNTTITNISIPNSVKIIGNFAFSGCSGLSGKLELPEGLTSIGNSAFYGCSGFSGDLTIPDTVIFLGSSAFYGCGGFKGTLKLPESLTKINAYTFQGCSGLSGTLVIPERTTAIDKEAFSGCHGIKEVIFGNGIGNLYGDSYSARLPFYGCTGVETLTFQGANVPVINDNITAASSYSNYIKYFFGGNSFGNLTTIYVPEGYYSRYSEAYGPYLQAKTRIREMGSEDFIIENGVLTAYTGTGEDVKVPEEVREIGERAFQNNTTLKNIELPSGLETIGAYAFSGCSALKGVRIPGNVTEIGSSAFYNCTGLTGELELPEGLISIGDSAFSGCKGIKGTLTLPGSLEKVNDSTFSGCSGLSGELELPEGLRSIGNSAFSGCSGLSGNLVIPDSVTFLGNSAFYGCSGFKGTLTLSGALEKVNASTFYGCSGLSGTLVIPERTTAIDKEAFSGCYGIKEVIFGNGIGNLYGDSYSARLPFYGCTGVETLTFQGANVPVINDNITAASSYSNYIKYFFGGNSFKNLKTIYTLQECLDKYKSAWGSYVPSTVSFSADTMSLPVSNITTEYVYSHSVKLKWMQSVNKNIVGYYIYRDGEFIADTAEPVFEEENLSSDTKYTYTITGHTDSGEKTPDTEITVTTKTPEVASVYTDNKLNKVGQSNGYIYALVKDSQNLGQGAGRFYYLDKNNEKIQIGDDLTDYESKTVNGAVYKIAWDIADIESDNYTVIFEFTDRDGETNARSQTITVDNSRPEAISSVVAVGGTNQIVLSWTIAHEIDTTKYYIYRRTEGEDSYTLIKKVYDRNTLTYTDTKAEKNLKSYYYITGVNDFGQEGYPSDIAVAMPEADTELPRVVQLLPVNGSIIGGRVELYAQAQDNVAVTKTELYVSLDEGRTWTLLKAANNNYCKHTLSTTEYEDSMISIKSLAYDAAGNVSNGLSYQYKIDNTGPEKVTGLSYESTATTITLKWNDVADQDFSFFRVEQELSDGSYKKVQDVYTTLGVNIYSLQSDTGYRYRVAAYDQLGNRGEVSDVLEAHTLKDSIAPVITSIKPDAGYYNNKIDVKITATDNTGIASILLQTSTNAVLWNDYKTFSFSGKNKKETASQVIDLSKYEEGYFYIRGIAADAIGNKGDDSKSAPYVQYIIDRTAPATPKNFHINSVTGAIEVSWDMGSESDLDGYTLYRSVDGENYSVIADHLYSVNYWDRSVKKGLTYYYKLAVCDAAGNESGKTEAVSGIFPDDTVKPEIQSYLPADKSTIGPSNSAFQVMASDNWKLDRVSVTYTVNEESTARTLLSQQNINDYYKVLSAQIPISNLNDGDILHFKISAVDAQGLETTEDNITYTVDKTAPRVNNINVEGGAEKIKINWSGNAESDLAGYRIYRKTAQGNYSMIAQRSAVSGVSYVYNDYNAQGKETYYYKVEAVDKYGNTHTKESEAVCLVVEPTVTALLNCGNVMELGVEYYFDASSSSADLGIDAYKFDFGDGTIVEGNDAKVIHKYSKVGRYTVALTIADKEGRTAAVKKEITVEEPKMLGTIKVKAVDGNGKILGGTPVYFDLDRTSENVKYTDPHGFVTFAAGAGQYAVGAYKDGYLPVKKSVIVRANTETEMELTLIEEPIVTGEFEVHRMTLDEIIAAGIDVSNPANQQVVKVTVHLTYGTQTSSMNIVTNGKNIYSGDTMIIDTDEGRRKITANVINVNTSNGGGSGSIPAGPEDVIIALLDVPVEASYLKEFFDVKLHIVNHTDTEFNLSNNEVTLNVPNGMSLVEAYGSNSSKTVRFDKLAGQEEKTVTWTLRGDDAGKYDLSADYQAVLEQFNAPVSATFTTDTPIEVYGKRAIKLIVDANYQIAQEAFYFDVSIQNTAKANMYLPNIEIADNIVKVYQNKVALKAGGEKEDNGTRELRYLNSYVKNKSGYKEYIGTNASVSTLEPDSRYTKQYVVYDAIEYDGIAYLQEAVYEITDGLGIGVEINFSKTDVYSTENAEGKLKNPDRFSKVMNVIDKNTEYFYYYAQAMNDDDDFLKKLGEAFYISSDAVFNLDFSGFTGENMKDITRNYIYEMLLDDAFQEAVENKIDNKYIEMTSSVLGVIGGAVQDISDKNDIEVYNSILKDGDKIRKLAKGWKDEGSDKFMVRLSKLCISNGMSKLAVDKLNAVYQEDKLNGLGIYGAFGDAVNDACSKITSGLKVVTDLTTAWNESAELTKQFVTITAAQEEAMVLTDMLLEHKEINGAVYEEIQEIRNGLERGFASQSQSFVNELKDIAVKGAISKAIPQVLKTIDNIYHIGNGAGAAAIYSAFKIAFNTFDYLLEWENRVDELQKLRVAASLTYALRSQSIYGISVNDYEKALKALKYLIKMRIAGEKIYVDIAKKRDSGKVLNAVNNCNYTGKNNFKTLDEYYNALLDELLHDRDTIYNTTYSQLDIPEAPSVTVDYVGQCTTEKFDDDYEYSFNGTDWVTCDGRNISITPKTVGQKLWVRIKESSTNKAGNITKISILGKTNISGNIKVFYNGAEYRITGLSQGNYYYLLTNMYGDSVDTLAGSDITVTDTNNTVLKEKGEYKYLKLARKAANFTDMNAYYGFDSNERTISVDPDAADPSPTVTATPIETVTPIITITPMVTATPTETVIPTVTVMPTVTSKPTITTKPTEPEKPIESITPTVTDAPTMTAQPTVTEKPTETVMPTITDTPTETASPTVTDIPTETPSSTVTVTPQPKTVQNITNKYNGTVKRQIGFRLTQKVTGARTKVTFKSSNPKVAKVGKSSGVIICKGVGEAIITSKAAGSSQYKAVSKKMVIRVLPKTVKVESVKSKKKRQVTVKFSNIAKENDGYQIQYKHNGEMKVVEITDKKAVAKTFKKLESGKPFKVRIRAYKKVDGKTYCGNYGKWKTLKKVK